MQHFRGGKPWWLLSLASPAKSSKMTAGGIQALQATTFSSLWHKILAYFSSCPWSHPLFSITLYDYSIFQVRSSNLIASWPCTFVGAGLLTISQAIANPSLALTFGTKQTRCNVTLIRAWPPRLTRTNSTQTQHNISSQRQICVLSSNQCPFGDHKKARDHVVTISRNLTSFVL